MSGVQSLSPPARLILADPVESRLIVSSTEPLDAAWCSLLRVDGMLGMCVRKHARPNKVLGKQVSDRGRDPGKPPNAFSLVQNESGNRTVW